MNHVPILAILSTKKLIFSAFAILVLFASLFVSLLSVNTASASPYTDEYADITKKIKAIKYFGLVKTCTSDTPGAYGGFVKTTISGTDIDNGVRWWTTDPGSGGINIGVYLDSWGDKNGTTGCNGESDSEPGWMNDMFKTLGIPVPSKSSSSGLGRKDFLDKTLGYTCSKQTSQWECTNSQANDGASTANSWQGILKALPYYGGVDPLTITEDRDAMTYYLALAALKNTSQCKAQAGGAGNLVKVAEVKPDGSVTTSDWSIKNDGGLTRVANSGLPLGVQGTWGTGGKTCQDMANYTVNNKNAYLAWSGRQACAIAYPAKASDLTFLTACGQGWANKQDYVMCSNKPAAGYSGSTFNPGGRNACFLGQGLPVDNNGQTAGELCMALGYSTQKDLTACITGAINRSNPDYCNKYYTGYYGGTFENHDDEREACTDGQSLKVSDGKTVLAGNITTTPPGGGSADDGKTSCVVDGIGWMICPLMNALGGLNDLMYGWVESVLVLNPLSQTDPATGDQTPQYQNWSRIRDIANVLLVVGFLAIIFSQITSIGISNYGVKKMLPRIVLIAIAINLSWVIMSLAIDVVNVVGVGLHALLDSAAVNASAQTLNFSTTVSDLVSGTALATIGAGAGVLAAFLTASGGSTLVLLALPFILGAVLALLAAVATLFLRNALVIVLVIISPVAIVAYLLPNTEEYFKKWRKLFTSMLFLFPMAALLFSGAKFAAYVIVTSNQPLAQIAALFVMAAPLGMLPWLANSAGGILSTVNGRLGGMAKSIQGATQRGLQNRVETGRAERRAGQRNFFGGRRNQYKGGTGEKHEEDVYAKTKKGKDKLDVNGNKILLAKKGSLKLDANGVPLGATMKRRTGSQFFAERGAEIKERGATAQKRLDSNWKQRGLEAPTSSDTKNPFKKAVNALDNNRAQRIAGVVDASKVEGLRGETIEAQYKGRLEVSKLVDGEVKTLYDRLQDAGTTSHSLEEEQKLRQKQRIAGNAQNTAAAAIGISRLAQVDAAGDAFLSDASATRLQNLATASIDAPGGAGLKILHENQEAAEQGIKTIDAQSEAELAARKKFGGDLFESAAAEAGYKATATAAGKRFDSTIKELATKKDMQERLLGSAPDKSDREKFPGGEADPKYAAAVQEWETKQAQLATMEDDDGVRKTLQEAATEDYVASSRIEQAEMDKKLGIDKEMQGNSQEARDLLRDATGVGTEKRVRASAARRLQEDRRGDVAATEDQYQRVGLGRDENLLIQGIDINGDELFDENGNFVYSGEEDPDKVWNDYVAARAKVGEPLPDSVISSRTLPPEYMIDDVQDEALVRRTIKEGDQRANERLPDRLAKKVAREQEKFDTWKATNPTATPEQVEEAESALTTAKKLQVAAIEQYASSPSGMSPFMSSGDRGALANGTLVRTGDEQIVNTFASEKVASPDFAAKWNIEHFKAAKKVFRELAKPLRPSRSASAAERTAVESALTARGLSPTDPTYTEEYDKEFDRQINGPVRATKLKEMIDENLRKDDPTLVPGNPRYDEEYRKRVQSFSDARKGLDSVDDDPAYQAVDGRAHAEIKIIRDALDVLQSDGAIPAPTAKNGVPYRRRSFTSQPGVVETTNTGGIVYLDQHDEPDPTDPTKSVVVKRKYTFDAKGAEHIIESNEGGATVYIDGTGRYTLDETGNRIPI